MISTEEEIVQEIWAPFATKTVLTEGRRKWNWAEILFDCAIHTKEPFS